MLHTEDNHRSGQTNSIPMHQTLDAARRGEICRLRPLLVLPRSTRQLDALTGEDRKFSIRISATVHQILNAARSGYRNRIEREPRLGKKWLHGRQFVFMGSHSYSLVVAVFTSRDVIWTDAKHFSLQDWLLATTAALRAGFLFKTGFACNACVTSYKLYAPSVTDLRHKTHSWEAKRTAFRESSVGCEQWDFLICGRGGGVLGNSNYKVMVNSQLNFPSILAFQFRPSL